jgi:hypothetical protein
MEGKKFGLQAEEWIIAILQEEGFIVTKASYEEDHFYKVDFWIKDKENWIAVQFSVNREALTGWKGKDALRRGVVPMWIDGNKLKEAKEGHFEKRSLVTAFWNCLEKIRNNFSIKTFPAPHWTSI